MLVTVEWILYVFFSTGDNEGFVVAAGANGCMLTKPVYAKLKRWLDSVLIYGMIKGTNNEKKLKAIKEKNKGEEKRIRLTKPSPEEKLKPN